MKYRIIADVLGQSVELEGEVGTAQTVRDIVRELLGYDKEVKVPAVPEHPEAKAIETLTQAKPTTSPARVMAIVSGDEPGIAEVVTLPAPSPTVDDVADAVKGLVTRLGAAKGVPKASSLLQEFGAAHAKNVPEEKRAAFIAKANEVTA